MDHSCPRCGYEAATLQLFRKHISRKTICEPLLSDITLDALKDDFLPKELPFECSYCERKFTGLHGLSKHGKKCTAKQLIILEQKVIELETAITNTNITNNINQTNIQNNTNNQTNNITINISPLGCEDISYMTPEFMLDCVQKNIDGLVQFVIKKHFDAEHPENHNIKSDGDNYVFLEVPELSTSRNIIEKTKTKDGQYWCKMKKMHALDDNIMPRVESAFKGFFKTKEDVPIKYIEEFVELVVFPMDWTMDLEIEDDLEAGDTQSIKNKIFKKIKESIDENYEKLMMSK